MLHTMGIHGAVHVTHTSVPSDAAGKHNHTLISFAVTIHALVAIGSASFDGTFCMCWSGLRPFYGCALSTYLAQQETCPQNR